MNKAALARMYQEIIEDTLGLKADIDADGDVVCKHPDMGYLFICLDEKDPEYFMMALPWFADAESLGMSPEQLLEVVNHVNGSCKAIKLSASHRNIAGQPYSVKATAECFLAGHNQAPSAEIIRSVLKRYVRAMVCTAGNLFHRADELGYGKTVDAQSLQAAQLH